MPVQASPPRAATREFLPASFAERGAHVPFTSPMLAHARLRIGKRGAREVVIRNPGGGDGWYVGQWHTMIDAARLSVHDRLLYRRIDAAEVIEPLAVRRIAREVLLEGFAGRAARDAAEAALAAETGARLQAHATLLARVLADCGAADRAGLLVRAGTEDELTRLAPGLLGDLATPSGQAAATLCEPVAALAALLAPVGLPAAGLAATADSQLGRDLAEVRRLVGALDEAATDQAGLDHLLVVGVQRCAETAVRLAEAACRAALAGTARPLALLDAGPPAIARRGALVLHMAWLLDGWPALAAAWSAACARGTPAMRRALVEIALNVPPMPREADAPPDLASPGPGLAAPQRWVRAGQDWLTGIAERDLVAHNEMLLARTI